MRRDPAQPTAEDYIAGLLRGWEFRTGRQLLLLSSASLPAAFRRFRLVSLPSASASECHDE
eukprot:4301078-Pyramimonas_sp.AAC.1